MKLVQQVSTEKPQPIELLEENRDNTVPTRMHFFFVLANFVKGEETGCKDLI